MLAWHVDYWDYLGWKDPFGSKYATRRQRAYAKALGMKQIGTPFLYVANRRVRGKAMAAAIRKSAQEAAPFYVSASAWMDNGKVRVFARTHRLTGDAKVEVMPVLVQRKAVTKCTAGECKGRTLTEYHAVVEAAPARPATGALVTAFAPPTGVKPDNLSVAILVEAGASTLACASVAIETAPEAKKSMKTLEHCLAIEKGMRDFIERVGAGKPVSIYEAEESRLCKARRLTRLQYHVISALTRK